MNVKDVWVHLIAKLGDRQFKWRQLAEAPGGAFVNDVLAEGDNAYSLNPFNPPRLPWIMPATMQPTGNLMLASPGGSDTFFAQLVTPETAGSYAWRRVDPAEKGTFVDAEDMPHAAAFEPNRTKPSRLPWNVRLAPRSIKGEYMFYIGGY